MVFACLYPTDAGNFSLLEDTIEKIKLTDASVESQAISNEALGSGFRCGFLGVLHMEVFRQRIEEESGLDVIIAAPCISYKAKLKNSDEFMKIDSPEEFPDSKQMHQIEEYVTIAMFIVFLFMMIKHDKTALLKNHFDDLSIFFTATGWTDYQYNFSLFVHFNMNNNLNYMSFM